MRLIRPFGIGFADLTTSIPEDDAPVWDVAASYSIGDQVIRDHRVYVSTIDSNLGNDPTNENQLLTSARWLQIGYTNGSIGLIKYGRVT